MIDTVVPTLREWESYYVIVGSSAGALTGLQFVVLTLITDAGALRGTSETLSAFSSPNVVHFCVALLLSAVLSMPWHGLAPVGVLVAIVGAGGLLYSLNVLRIARRQRDYKPVLEDWIWHAGLPILAYAACIHAGTQLPRSPEGPAYIVAVATLLLVFIGIHNAWDTVTYVTLQRMQERERSKRPPTAPPPLPPAA
jgi:hypothetical protein